MRVPSAFRRPALVLSALLLCACASNPVTHRSQLMLISQEKEVRIGEEASKEIKREYGYYDELPGLNAYLNEVGEKLVAQSDRRDLLFHFQVLNSPVINAFALPGGYVYVTRGLLARINTEEDLASVLGHEITHVSARHGAAMISKAYAAQSAFLLAAIFYPQAMGAFGDLANLALNLAFLGHSRAMEAQADEYGIRYMVKAGYSPLGAVDCFQMFKSIEDHEPGKMERFLLSHPPTEQRLAFARQRLADLRETNPALADAPLRREVYLRRLENLMLGQADGEKVVVENVFYHKHYGAAFTFPDAYSAVLNPKEGEVVLRRDQKEGEGDNARRIPYLIGFEVNPLHKQESVESYVEGYLKAMKAAKWDKGIERAQTREGLPLVLKTLDMSGGDEGPVRVLAGFLLRGKEAYVLYGMTLRGKFDAARPGFLEVISSLRFPPAGEVAQVQPPRLRLVTAAAGDTWASLSVRELGSDRFAEKLAAYNGTFDPAVQPPAGTLLKIPSRQSLTAKEM